MASGGSITSSVQKFSDVDLTSKISVELLLGTLTACNTGTFFYPVSVRADNEVLWTPAADEMAWTHNMAPPLMRKAPDRDLPNFLSQIYEADLNGVLLHLSIAIKEGRTHGDCEYRTQLASGEVGWVLMRYVIGRDAAQLPLYLAGVSFDITERKRTEEQLQHAHSQLEHAQHFFRAALSASGMAIFRQPLGYAAKTTDIDTWNFNLAPIFGYDADTHMTLELQKRRMHPDDLAAISEKASAALRAGACEYEHEYRIQWSNQSERWLLTKFSIEFNPGGEPEYVCGAVLDITDRKQAEERAHYLATHDTLTGLPNRMMFNNLLNHSIDTAKRYSHKFAILFIDLDRFKMINDALGHEAGDILLQEIAQRLRDSLRVSDVVARLSGDEFVVMMPEVEGELQASTLARKIIGEIMKPVTLRAQVHRVTASIGISVFPDHGIDEQTLLKSADIAMYQAKAEGKNNFQFYSTNCTSQLLERMAIENELRSALENNEFSLHYQAKLDLHDNRITGVEALLRWNNARLGMVSPAQFIPVAEETGLIVQIGFWVLKTACKQNVEWSTQGLQPVCVAVNLSPRQFSNEALLDHIKDALDESGMAPELLELEITESMVMSRVDQAVQLLHEIKKLGVRIAIDDFGTGYSSLAQLKSFPIDTLKVDRSFIRDVTHDAEDRAITEAIIAMGKSLSLTIIAEGVETQEQQDFLRQRACDEMQGYYFSKPVVAAEFFDLLKRHTSNPAEI